MVRWLESYFRVDYFQLKVSILFFNLSHFLGIKNNWELWWFILKFLLKFSDKNVRSLQISFKYEVAPSIIIDNEGIRLFLAVTEWKRERERERESSLNISDDFPPTLLLSARPFLVKSRKCNFSPRDRTEVDCLSTPCRAGVGELGEYTKHFIGSQFRNLRVNYE